VKRITYNSSIWWNVSVVRVFAAEGITKAVASAHRPATNDRPLVVASNGPVEVPLG